MVKGSGGHACRVPLDGGVDISPGATLWGLCCCCLHGCAAAPGWCSVTLIHVARPQHGDNVGPWSLRVRTGSCGAVSVLDPASLGEPRHRCFPSTLSLWRAHPTTTTQTRSHLITSKCQPPAAGAIDTIHRDPDGCMQRTVREAAPVIFCRQNSLTENM